MRTIFLICAFMLVWTPAFSDTVTLNSGDEIFGKVEKMTVDSVTIIDEKDSKVKTFNKSELLKVVFWGLKKVPGEERADQIKNKQLAGFLKQDISEKTYPNAGHVSLIDEMVVEIHADGSIDQTIHIASKILKERSRDLSNVSCYYKKGEDTADVLFARTIDGNNLYYLREDAVQEESVYYALKEYEKLRKIKFAVPKASINTVVEYSYKLHTFKHSTDNPFDGSFIFQEKNPKLSSRLVVKVARGVDFGYMIQNNKTGLVKEKKYESGDYTVYEFYADNIPGYESEPMMPPYNRYFPIVVYGINYGFDKTAALFADKINNAPVSENVKNKARELCSGLTDDHAKADAIYQYVVKEISNKGVSLSSYSYLPKSAERIFSNKFASYLDMTYLYYAMLKAVDVAADFCYVRSFRSGDIAENYGNIGQFSTTCVYIRSLSEYVFPHYDCAAMDELDPYYHGARVFNINTGKLGNILMEEPAKNMQKFSADMKLDRNGSMAVKTVTDYTGSECYSVREMKGMTEKEIDQSVAQGINSIHPNARLIDYSYENITDLDKTPVSKTSYEIDDYALRASDKLMVFKIPGLSYGASQVGKPDRDYPLYWGTKSRYENKMQIRIPDGYSVYYMPAGVHENCGGISYIADFSCKNGVITFTDSFETGVTELPKTSYKHYKTLIEKRARLTDEWIVIKKN